jgi:hypothetical protein
LRNILGSVEELKDIDVSGSEDPYCVISFTTKFSGDAAYDLELTKTDSGFKATLVSSAETPVMQDSIESLSEDELGSLLDHVVETLRELESN